MSSRRCVGMLTDGSRCHRNRHGDDAYCERCDERLTEVLASARLRKEIAAAATKTKTGDAATPAHPGKSN